MPSPFTNHKIGSYTSNSTLKIPAAVSRHDATEAKQIAAFVSQRKIKYLCHFTTVENLEGIVHEGGLLSNPQLQHHNQQYIQIDRERKDGKPYHLCCSINSYNWMYHYHARSRHTTQCWVLLAIQPDYLWKQKTLFCPINAASASGAHVKEGFAALKIMFAPVVTDIFGRKYDRQKLEIPDYLPTCIQAEVLVYESISLEDVISIWVNEDPGNEQKVRKAGWQGKVEIWRSLFK